ncbi:MAG: ATP synthase F1 subunit delta [Bacteroidota bacterium]|nr:ATP synthase F1 subunit delta [Bacteroidota bacterium]
MLNSRLAGRYAKSLIDLTLEQGQLDAVYNDIQYMNSLMKKSTEFITILKSPVIPGDKKQKVLEALTAGRISIVTASFNRLLINKGREGFLPDIVQAFIEQYKVFKGIHTVTLTSAVPVSDDVKNAIIRKIREVSDMEEVELETFVDEKIIGGFILEADGRRVDASVAYDLANIKKQFSNNDFIYRIR